MNNSLLSAHQISCCRGERILFDALSFCVDDKELLQITGENGSGKTTLLRILTGLYPLQTGEIYWQGKKIQADRENYQRQIYYLSHSLGIKNELTVAENLQLYWATTGKMQTDAVLARLNLLNYKNQLCRQLSRGQRQRVALVRLMLSGALIWILDEPFASLDQEAVTLLQQVFLEKIQTAGAVIFTSHQPLTLPLLQPKIVSL